jgi:hypothetical protein
LEDKDTNKKIETIKKTLQFEKTCMDI